MGICIVIVSMNIIIIFIMIIRMGALTLRGGDKFPLPIPAALQDLGKMYVHPFNRSHGHIVIVRGLGSKQSILSGVERSSL